MITDEQLTEWEALANGAAPADWYKFGEYQDGKVDVSNADRDIAARVLPADAAFIAESRTAVPALIEEVRRLRAAIDGLMTCAYAEIAACCTGNSECPVTDTHIAIAAASAALRGSKCAASVARNPPPGCRPPIDWAAMATEEVLAALRSAPKVAGAWGVQWGSWRRSDETHQCNGAARVFALGSEVYGGEILGSLLHDIASSLDEAKAAVDAELVRRGWRLL